MSKLELDWHLWWLVSVHLTRTRVSQEEGVPVEKIVPIRLVGGPYLWHSLDC